MNPVTASGIQVLMTIASAFLFVVAAYIALGIAFALLFVTRGVGRIDHAAVGAPWSFRLLIFPGAVALWPLMLSKWLRVARLSPAGDHTS